MYYSRAKRRTRTRYINPYTNTTTVCEEKRFLPIHNTAIVGSIFRYCSSPIIFLLVVVVAFVVLKLLLPLYFYFSFHAVVAI